MNWRHATRSSPGASERRRALTEFADPENLEPIADALAMQGRIVVDDFFGPALTAALRSECLASNRQREFHEAAVGGGERRRVQTKIRGDEISWMQAPGATGAQRDFADRFEQLRLMLNRSLQFGLFDFESHFSRYAAGAFYARHLDQLRGDSHRKLSCVLYLNENWTAQEGGALRVYLDGGGAEFEDVLPQAGRLVAFLSDRFAHEVLPSTRERLSIAGWFRTR